MDLNRAENALIRKDLPGVCRELARLYPNDPALDQLPDLVRFALDDNAVMPRLTGIAAPFVASIAGLKNVRLGPDMLVPARHRTNRHVIGAELDFLGDRHWPDQSRWEMEDWTAARGLNQLMLGLIQPSRRAAVVGTMRDDGIYALEWTAHYITLGFEGLFIYTNDNADGSEHLLRRLADHGVITLIESETSGGVRPEVKAFDHAINLLHDLRDYEWVLFADSDEFFQPGTGYHHSVMAILDDIAKRFGTQPPAAIAYEWLWFNSGMVFERKPGLLMERFQYATPHWLTKPLVRLHDAVSMRMQHIPNIRTGGFITNSMLDPIDPDQVWERRPATYGGGQINHYWPKSFEEFSLKKARGDALKLADPDYRRDFRLFFEWNGPETPETHHPPDRTFLDAVKQTLLRLRALDGITEIEADVERGFRQLLRRYDATGGLWEIYRGLKRDMATIEVPGSV